MKILLNSLIIVMAAALGLVAGFAWRGKPGRSSAATELRADSSSDNSATNRFRFTKKFATVRAHDDSPLATQLERDLSLSSGVTRWLYWLEAIEKAAPSDFPRLARLAQGNATATKLLAARWVEVAPRHLFDTLVAAAKDGRGFPADELATVLFEEWPKRDPDAVIAALSDTNHPGLSRDWRFNVAYKLIEKDFERGVRLMSEWNVNDIGFGTSGLAAVTKWTRANPRHAAEFMLAQPDGYAVRSTMETIGKEWARTDPASALEFASTKTDGMGVALADAVLKNWAGRNLNAAADWLAGTDSSTRNRLSPAFVEAWAKRDAGGALAWCEANLFGSSLAQAVGGVSKGAAESDVVGAAGLVTDMKPSSARAEAAAGVAQKWFPESFAGKPVPPEAIEWMKRLDADSVKRVLDQIHFRWLDSDPKSLAAFLATTTSDKIPEHIYVNLARNMARQNPVETLEWASRLPAERRLSVGGEAFTEWRRSQPASATQWLDELPAADPRRPVIFEKEIQRLAYDMRGPAAEQLTALSAHEQVIARDVIAKMNLPDDRRAKLLDALKPPLK